MASRMPFGAGVPTARRKSRKKPAPPCAASLWSKKAAAESVFTAASPPRLARFLRAPIRVSLRNRSGRPQKAVPTSVPSKSALSEEDRTAVCPAPFLSRNRPFVILSTLLQRSATLNLQGILRRSSRPWTDREGATGGDDSSVYRRHPATAHFAATSFRAWRRQTKGHPDCRYCGAGNLLGRQDCACLRERVSARRQDAGTGPVCGCEPVQRGTDSRQYFQSRPGPGNSGKAGGHQGCRNECGSEDFPAVHGSSGPADVSHGTAFFSRQRE